MDQPLPSGRESATEPVLRSRLLPRISFQSLLIFTAISAVVIAVVYAADQGGTYAIASAAGLFFALCMFVCSALLFLLSWAVSFLPRATGATLLSIGVGLALCRFIGVSLGALSFLLETIWLINFQIVGWFLIFCPILGVGSPEGENPFADGQLPPQILAPREPSN